MSALVGELLRVVQLAVLVIGREDDGSGIDAACQTTAAGLVAAGLDAVGKLIG